MDGKQPNDTGEARFERTTDRLGPTIHGPLSARVGSTRSHGTQVALVAVVFATVVLAAIKGGPGTAAPAVTTQARAAVSPLPPPSSQAKSDSRRPGYQAGQLLRATKAFELTDDWMVREGQSLYVVARGSSGSGETYTLQHWGDLVTELRPDTVVGTVSATLIEARTEAYVPACPTQVAIVEDIGALQPFDRLSCFGADDLTFGPAQRKEYAVMAGTPPWLGGEARVDFFTAIPFDVANGIEVPDRQWLRITGHFDDPACAGDIRCRERFVVTAADPTDPPPFELQGTWTRMAEAPISGRSSYVAIPIDGGTFIWGGDGPDPDEGAIYRASDNSWARIVASRDRSPRYRPAAVWTGDEILIWGGNDDPEGLRYDPAADRWG